MLKTITGAAQMDGAAILKTSVSSRWSMPQTRDISIKTSRCSNIVVFLNKEDQVDDEELLGCELEVSYFRLMISQ
jgi:elongation factor Tu